MKLGCIEEARQVLRASLTIRHAILSLRALREDLKTSGDGAAFIAQQTSSHHYGLQQYSIALGGVKLVVSRLQRVEVSINLLSGVYQH